MEGSETIRVYFSTDTTEPLNFNAYLRDPVGGKPFGRLTPREAEIAVFEFYEHESMQALTRIRERRGMRALMIEQHFEKCARLLIERIESGEPWAMIEEMIKPTQGEG